MIEVTGAPISPSLLLIKRDLRQEYKDDDQSDLFLNNTPLMSSQMQDLQRLRILSSQVELDTAVAA